MGVTVEDLARFLGAELRGEGGTEITGVATLQDAAPDQLTFLANSRYRKFLAGCRAGAVLLRPDDAPAFPGAALLVDDPYLAFAKATAYLYPAAAIPPGIHSSAVVDPTARIDSTAAIGALAVIEAEVDVGPRAVVGPGCVVRSGCRIGADSHLTANVTLCVDTVVGQRVLIHPGAVLGSDGFGFANENGRWLKVPQIGRVRIGDDVEIGANTTIDRGALTDTIVEDGVKLDNLIQIAHNVQVGRHTAMAACVGVAGSAKIGAHCAIGGGAGILGHLELVDGVQVTAMSLVTHSLREPGVYSSGTPIQPNTAWQKNAVRTKQLDQMARRLRELETEFAQIRQMISSETSPERD